MPEEKIETPAPKKAAYDPKHRFVGSVCELNSQQRKFSDFGEAWNFTEKEAKDLIGHPRGAAFIPEKDFLATGLSDEEIQRYHPNNYFDEVPAAFIAKVTAAKFAIHAYRAKLIAA